MVVCSAIISQLVYSAGGSGFAGANGSMMIEVVVSGGLVSTPHCTSNSGTVLQPFFHILANSIAADIGEDRPHEVLATTIVAFALSSVLTGRSGATKYHSCGSLFT